MRRFGIVAAAFLVSACATGGSDQTHVAAVPAIAQESSPGSDRPIADHHIHLLSPAAAAWKTPAPLPEIELPRDLERVLNARNELRNDQHALEEIYATDAIYHSGGGPGWARGKKAAAGRVVWTISDFPYRIAPVAYSQRGSSAQIAGYFLSTKDYSDANRNGSSTQVAASKQDLTDRFGTSLLSLRKETDGEWRIAAEVFTYEVPSFAAPVTAQDKIKEMDGFGTRLGAVVSNAYYFDSAQPEPVQDALAKVQADNDWVAEQVSQYPHRLVAFCSVDPVEAYALAELERCASSGRFLGLKLHFNAAQVKVRDPGELAKIRSVMAAANTHRMPMIIHVRPGNDYGAEVAEIFIRQLVAVAPDVPIQVAHLWGGESYDASALRVYADAVSAGDPRTRNLYFDVSAVLMNPRPAEEAQDIAARMRQIGMHRLLWGSDAPIGEVWDGFRKNVPLTEEEFHQIASNVAPYLRSRQTAIVRR